MSKEKPPRYFIWKEWESDGGSVTTHGFIVIDSDELKVHITDLKGRDVPFNEGGTELPRFIVHELVPRSRAVDVFVAWVSQHTIHDHTMYSKLAEVLFEYLESGGVESKARYASGVFRLAKDDIRSTFSYYVSVIIGAVKRYKDDRSRFLAIVPGITKMHATLVAEADRLVVDTGKRKK